MHQLVSIIIPTYNRESTIERSILSVLEQTYKNTEIIVIDDGSTDETESIVEKLMSKHWNIKFYRTKNLWVSHARNYWVSKASWEYISLLDSDDEYLEDRIEKQLEEMKKLDIPFSISSSMTAVDGKIQKYIDTHLESRVISIDDIMNWKIRISASFFMFKKGINAEFDESLPSWNDFDFILQVQNNNKILCVHQILNIWHKTMKIERISTNPNNKIMWAKRIIQKINNHNYNLSKLNSESLYMSMLEIICMFSFLGGDKKDWRIYAKKVLFLKPTFTKKVKYSLLYILSFIPFCLESIIFASKLMWKFNILKI